MPASKLLAAPIAVLLAVVISPRTRSQEQRTPTPLSGFADIQIHQFADLGLGGSLPSGSPFNPEGNIATALPRSAFYPSGLAFGKVEEALPAIVLFGAAQSPRRLDTPVESGADGDADAPSPRTILTGWTPRPKIRGMADVHNHQFSNYGFGGLINFGNAFDTCDNDPSNDLQRALAWSHWTPVRPHDCARITGPGDIAGAPILKPGFEACPAVPGINRPANFLPLTWCTHNCPEDTAIFVNECPGAWVHGPGGILDFLNPFACIGATFGHQVGGFGEFDGYPRWNNCTGQKVYHEWLKRAFDGGQKLMVMLAVNSEGICNVVPRFAAYGCDDTSAIERQIQGAKDLEAYIDRLDDGQMNGSGWYKIVYTPQQARDAIAGGKMAVVLGVEVAGLFGCKTLAVCTQLAAAGGHTTVNDYVKSELDRLYSLGVRHLFPIHGLNNAFGATGTWNDIYFFATRLATGSYPQLTNDCPAGFRYHYDLIDQLHAASDILAFLGAALGGNPFTIAIFNAAIGAILPPLPPPGPNCNAEGLTDEGKFLINLMMDKKMIIDVDHMSARSFDDVLTIAESIARRYAGIVSSHTAMLGLGDEDIDDTGGPEFSSSSLRHEAHRTDDQMARIRDIGGFQGLILQQGERKQLDEFLTGAGPRVSLDCGHSGNAWVQQYLYAVEQYKGGKAGKVPGIGIASDTAGATMTAPRFGAEACGGDRDGSYDTNGGLSYPFDLSCATLPVPGACGPGQGPTMDKHQVGNRVFDVNLDGVAHVGLLPDFVRDLQAMGLTPGDLLPLFSGAEGYVCTWENAYNGVTEGDVDADGFIGFCDNCPADSNSDQTDTDNDGYGNVCDTDDDNDGFSDLQETGSVGIPPGNTQGSNPLDANSRPEVCDGIDNDLNEGSDEGFPDTDGDGTKDCLDPDDDNDTVLDSSDNCPLAANSDQKDFDGDTIGDICDPDTDNDGVQNSGDKCAFTPLGEAVTPSGCTTRQGIQWLLNAVTGMGLPAGATRGLLGPLNEALDLLNDANSNNNVCGKLQGFINEGKAHEQNGSLTSPQASELRREAEALFKLLGC